MISCDFIGLAKAQVDTVELSLVACVWRVFDFLGDVLFPLTIESFIRVDGVGVINKGLKVLNFNDLTALLLILDEGVEALFLVGVHGEQTLDLVVVDEV